MIPFIRSSIELMFITHQRDRVKKDPEKTYLTEKDEDSGQRKRYIRHRDEKSIDLPALPKADRRKWKKGKEIVSKFFDELDYNNQIQSSYELTLLERQNKSERHDVA